MTITMTDKDLALLTTKLEVPMIIRDALECGTEINEETQYGLHQILSDMKPDSALLSLALSTKIIASHYTGTDILMMECDRIINDYGQLWLDNAHNQKIDNDYLLGVLDNIPCDLEGLMEIMQINLSYAALESAAISQILDIFQIQADAHAIIAEEFLSILEMASAQQSLQKLQVPSELAALNSASDNIVAFRV